MIKTFEAFKKDSFEMPRPRKDMSSEIPKKDSFELPRKKDTFEMPRSNKPIYVAINTIEYNNDGKVAVQQAVGLEQCDDLGWRSNDVGINLYTHEECKLKDLKVGEIMESVEYKGAYIMRIA